MHSPQQGLGSDGRWLEAASGTAAVAWSIPVLAVPGDLAAHLGYVPLSLFLPDWLFGLLMLAGGALQGYAARRNHVHARIPFAALLAAGWLLIAYSVAIATPLSPTWPLPAVLGGWNIYAMLVLGHLVQRRP